MKTFNAVYRHGHLYDRDTQKRLLLKDNVELAVVINSDRDDLFPADPRNNPDSKQNRPRSPEVLWQQILSKNLHKVEKVADRGQYVYFTIRVNDRTANELPSSNFCFRVQLLEELYLVWKSPDIALGEFFARNTHSCSCVVDKVESGSIDPSYFEPIYGSSLNAVRTLTYEMYFPRYAPTTTNIYTSLTFQPNERGEPFMGIRERANWDRRN